MIARLHSSKRNVERGREEKNFDVYRTTLQSDWFLIKTKVSDWVEQNFFSLTVFGGNLLAGNVHSNVTMDKHVQVWQ